jgi:hypothetical protein
MSRNSIIVLIYHRHKLLKLIFNSNLRILSFLNTPSGLIIAAVKANKNSSSKTYEYYWLSEIQLNIWKLPCNIYAMFRSYDHLQVEIYLLGFTRLTTDPLF